MPTPIGHALAGLAVAGLGARKKPTSVLQVGVLVFCATAPDLDLLLKFADGANHHRGATHSLTAAILIGVLGFAAKALSGVDFPGGVSMSAAWASHVLLDYLGLDTSPPVGEMVLWPFSTAFHASPICIFYDVSRALSVEMIRHNTIAVLIELVVLIPVALLCWRPAIVRRADS